MPWNQVMPKWKAGKLHSGSKQGPPVKGQKQAVAIMLSEKKKADAGNEEYAPLLGKEKTVPAKKKLFPSSR